MMMAIKKKTNNYNNDESGVWNVSRSFAEGKLMKPLLKVDEYEILAINGFSDSQNNLTKNQIDYNKFTNFKSLVANLRLIISNNKFAIKKNIEKFDKYERILVLISKMIDDDEIAIINCGKINLIHSKYYNILSIVSDIKLGINFVLNDNNLIYMNREEYDPLEHKKALMERVANI